MQTALATHAPTSTRTQSKSHPASDYFNGPTQRQTLRSTDLDALLRTETGSRTWVRVPDLVGNAEAMGTAAATEAMYDPMDGTGIALGLRSALLFNAGVGLCGFLVYEAWMFLAH